MKKLFIILVTGLFTVVLFAQSPQKMSYQAIIRDSGNALVTSRAVGMRISILQGSATGTSFYVETQTPTTNANGLVSIEIGGGAGFDAINWASGPYFIKTETDPVFVSHAASGVTPSLIGNWNTAYDWGSHAAAGYLTSYTETDPEVGANTSDYLSKWDGSALVSSALFDNGKIGLGTNNPSALLDLHIPNDFLAQGLNISMPDYANQTLNHQALTISSAWDAEGIARTNIFSLYDEESSPVMELRRPGYNYTTVLTPGSFSLSGENGNNIIMNWEEGFQYGTSTSGYNIQINTEFLFLYRTYSGTWTNRASINSQGNAFFAGNLQSNGTISGTGFRLSTGGATGNILTSNESGNASWQPAAGKYLLVE